MEDLLFDGDRLRFKSLKDYIAFKAFHDFANDKIAVDAHINSHEYYAMDPSLHEEGSEIKLGNQKAEDIQFSLNHFGGMTVASLCTTFEIAVKDFLCCYFFYNPNNMYHFIGEEGSRGLVPLKEMLAEDTYQGLMISLAKKASSKASKGKYSDVFSRVSKLCKGNVDNDILKELDNLQKDRNKIVHEKFYKMWELSEVSNFETLVSSVIEDICRFGIARNIPGKYTCVSGENRIELASVALLNQEKI